MATNVIPLSHTTAAASATGQEEIIYTVPEGKVAKVKLQYVNVYNDTTTDEDYSWNMTYIKTTSDGFKSHIESIGPPSSSNQRSWTIYPNNKSHVANDTNAYQVYSYSNDGLAVGSVSSNKKAISGNYYQSGICCDEFYLDEGETYSIQFRQDYNYPYKFHTAGVIILEDK